MKPLHLAAALLSAALGAAQASQQLSTQCDRTVTRMEYRDMGKADWDRFHGALMSLQNRTSPSGRAGWTEWDWWTQIHLDNMMTAHGTNLFLPWHRAYVLAMERRLQQIDPNITIPYWDWAHDWEAPLSSPILTEEYGFPVAVGSDPACRYPRQLFDRHCLIRDYNASDFPTYYSPSAISSVIESIGNYSEFRELIEMVPHAIVHTSLGGERGDMSQMNSPNDPIFFLHHSMVDYIWFIWQRIGGRARLYDGDLNQRLEPFGLTVADVLDSAALCVTYRPFSRDRGLIPSTARMASRRRQRLRPREWKVSRRFLDSYHIDAAALQQIVLRFNRAARLG